MSIVHKTDDENPFQNCDEAIDESNWYQRATTSLLDGSINADLHTAGSNDQLTGLQNCVSKLQKQIQSLNDNVMNLQSTINIQQFSINSLISVVQELVTTRKSDEKDNSFLMEFFFPITSYQHFEKFNTFLKDQNYLDQTVSKKKNKLKYFFFIFTYFF